MKHFLNHCNETFSQTDNVITYGQLYACVAVVLLLVSIIVVPVIKQKSSN